LVVLSRGGFCLAGAVHVFLTKEGEEP